LPGQIAVVEALRNVPYYREKWAETSLLRENLSAGLRNLGWDVVPGCANFLLCHLPVDQPETARLLSACRKRNLFQRNVSNMGLCFDNRSLRIAVKDAATNEKMIRILNMTLSELKESDES